MLLVVNAGSSSLKLALFDGLTEIRAARVGEIGAEGHATALSGLLAGGFGDGVTAAAHRVVHGGARLTAPRRIDDKVLAEIAACVPLAPLHNPANLVAIRALAQLRPDLPQYASFDTAFHATNPEIALRYALPPDAENDAPPHRLLALHLGNGCSLCAIENGRSVATTMGYSPLDGLTMGTRSGAIDGNAVLRLVELHGLEAASRMLNRQSGLLGLGGHSDMRALQAATTPEAEFAIQHFTYWAIRHAGSMIAAMGGLDAVAFTGGIGENDAGIRGEILRGLDWIARDKPVWIIPADEERQIAIEAQGLIAAGR